MQPTEDTATISPARAPLPPMDCAIGVEEMAAGEANTAKTATSSGPW